MLVGKHKQTCMSHCDSHVLGCNQEPSKKLTGDVGTCNSMVYQKTGLMLRLHLEYWRLAAYGWHVWSEKYGHRSTAALIQGILTIQGGHILAGLTVLC